MFIFYYCISSHASRPLIFTYVNSFIPSLFSSPNNCKKIFQSINQNFFSPLPLQFRCSFCAPFFPHFIPFMLQLLTPHCYPKTSHKTSFKSDPGCNFLFSGFPVSSPSRETNKTKPNIYTDPSKRHALKREEKFNK